MMLARFLGNGPGGLGVLPIPGPTLAHHQHRRPKAYLNEESLILILTSEFFLEAANAFYNFTAHKNTADARCSTPISQ
jgi:hypothetical protein